MSATATPAKEHQLKATRVGVVTSDKRQCTRTVAVQYSAKHPKYGKYLRREMRYHVHDANNESKKGDTVEIARCRPISKTKSWRLVRVIEVAPAPVETKKVVVPGTAEEKAAEAAAQE